MLHSVGLDALATANDAVTYSTRRRVAAAAEAYEVGEEISRHLLRLIPRVCEIWLDGKSRTDEKCLSQTYLPRKFKTTVVIRPERCRLHANADFVAIAENGKLVGFNLLVGGGLHRTRQQKPPPRVGLAICRWSIRWRWPRRRDNSA